MNKMDNLLINAAVFETVVIVVLVVIILLLAEGVKWWDSFGGE